MRKLSFIGGLLMATVLVYGQKREVNNAYNAYLNGYLDRAKDAIDKAITNDETAKEAKTWMYRGNIYLRIADSKDFQKLCTNCAEIAYESYMRAFQLDPHVTVENMGIKTTGEGLGFCAGYLYSDAVKLYEKNKFEEAHLLLDKANKAANGRQDYIMFLLAYTAELTGKKEVAKSVYNDMINRVINNTKMPSKDIRAYRQLAELYKLENDTVKMLNVLKIGEPLFLIEEDKEDKEKQEKKEPQENKPVQDTKNKKKPQDVKKTDDSNLSKETMKDTLYREYALIYSAYLSWAGKTDDAAEIIDNALEKYPDNHILLISYGTALSDDKQYAKAEQYLRKALEIQPNDLMALYNLGNCYYNNFVDIRNYIRDNPNLNDKEYQRLKDESKALLEESLPYLKKAHAMDSKDRNTIIMLRTVYLQMNLMEEYKAMDEKFNALGK